MCDMVYLYDKKNKPAGKCIFCEGGNLSKEHFWPKWAAELLPKFPNNEHVEHLSTFTQLTKPVGSPKIRTKQGNSWTKTVRVVCASCNNGWMSALETKVRPILTSLIATNPQTLPTNSLLVLSQWIALKVMVAEHNQRRDAVTPLEDRKAFKDGLKIPPNFQIWIAKCGTEGWEATYWRHAATVGFNTFTPPTDGLKNIHSITFGIGDLLIHVMQTSIPNWPHKFKVLSPNIIVPIYPIDGSVNWPPSKTLSAVDARVVVGTLDNFLRQNIVGWAPFPPKPQT